MPQPIDIAEPLAVGTGRRIVTFSTWDFSQPETVRDESFAIAVLVAPSETNRRLVRPIARGWTTRTPQFRVTVPGEPLSTDLETIVGTLNKVMPLQDVAGTRQQLQKVGLYAGGMITRGQRVQVEIGFDTDSPAFRRYVTQGGSARGTPLTLDFLAIARGAAQQQILKLPVTMTLLRQPEEDPGFLAIDFGNTGTTVMRMAQGDLHEKPIIKPLLDFDPNVQTDADETRAERVHPSRLRIRRTRQAQIDSRLDDRWGDRPDGFVCDIGAIAEAEFLARTHGTSDSPERIFSGMKRSLNLDDPIESGGTTTSGSRTKEQATRQRRSAAGRVTAPRELYQAAAGSSAEDALAEGRLIGERLVEDYLAPERPAELFLWEILRRFQRHTKRWPSHLAVTYPTTYSEREQANLYEAVVRAQKRSLYQAASLAPAPDRAFDPSAQPGIATDRSTLFMIDEASAAAFRHLYDYVFGQDGGLYRFRYLHPRGLHFLLYDYGGGTTDIALLRAVVESQAGGPPRLAVRVLGRSGHRTFGGDRITHAVFELLKAKLAQIVEREIARDPELDHMPTLRQVADAAAWRDWYRDHAATIDRCIPTTFDPEHDLTQKQRRVRVLWALAEQVKHRLGRKEASGAISAFDSSDVRNDFARALLIDSPLSASLHEGIADQWRDEVKIHLDEVNALIEQDVRVSVQRGLDLVRKKLLSATKRPAEAAPAATAKAEPVPAPAAVSSKASADWGWEELTGGPSPTVAIQAPPTVSPPPEPGIAPLDVVCVTGNASQYPLILSTISERFGVEIPSADPSASPSNEAAKDPLDVGLPPADRARLIFDRERLKYAVAEGAVLASALQKAGLGAGVDFDWNVGRRLPYDVSYRHAGQGRYIALYSENVAYEDLPPVEIAPLPQNTRRPSVTLYRRWPGGEAEQEAHEPLMNFEFTEPVQEPVVIRYDPKRRQFQASDRAGRVAEVRSLVEPDSCLAPVERGNL